MYRAIVAALLCVLPIAASSIEAYAYTAVGESSCATFSNTPQVTTTIGSGSISVSTPGPGCNVTESLMDHTGASGILNVSSGATGGGNSSFGTFSYSGTSQSQGSYSSLGVQADGTLTGATDGFSTRGSEAFANMIDGYTAPSTTPVNGFVQFNYVIHGSQTLSGRGETTIELLYGKDGGPDFLAFRAQNAASTGLTVNVNGAYVTSLPGMVLTTNSVTMDTALSFLVPAKPNEYFTLNMVLYGSAVPSPGSVPSTPNSIADDFLGTLTLTGINVLDGQGNVVSGATVLRDSSAVASPEPGSMMLGGVALLAAVAFRALRLRKA
jgi:hypothetical protein